MSGAISNYWEETKKHPKKRVRGLIYFWLAIESRPLFQFIEGLFWFLLGISFIPIGGLLMVITGAIMILIGLYRGLKYYLGKIF